MFKTILTADPELWGCDILVLHLSQTIFFGEKIINIMLSTYWPLSLCKFLKKSYSGSRVMRMRHFWAQNGPFAQMRIFFRKPVNKPFSFHSCLSTCQKSKSDINLSLTIKEYWNHIGREPFLAVIWEPDFSQACSFRKMLMKIRTFALDKFQAKLMTWFS